MASLTLSVSEEFKSMLKRFQWVNWSEIAREESSKKIIFEKFVKTGKVSDEDWEFCDRMDWHPVDELPYKEEFVRRMQKIRKGKFIRYKSVNEIFK